MIEDIFNYLILHLVYPSFFQIEECDVNFFACLLLRFEKRLLEIYQLNFEKTARRNSNLSDNLIFEA